MQVVTVKMREVDRLKLESGASNNPLHGGAGSQGSLPHVLCPGSGNGRSKATKERSGGRPGPMRLRRGRCREC